MEFSFFSMIAQASLVAKAVLALLVVMSITSWGLMIQKFFALSAANNKALEGTTGFEKAPNLREAVQSLGSDPSSPLYYIAHPKSWATAVKSWWTTFAARCARV